MGLHIPDMHGLHGFELMIIDELIFHELLDELNGLIEGIDWGDPSL